jgi:hypothetical protein
MFRVVNPELLEMAFRDPEHLCSRAGVDSLKG